MENWQNRENTMNCWPETIITHRCGSIMMAVFKFINTAIGHNYRGSTGDPSHYKPKKTVKDVFFHKAVSKWDGSFGPASRCWRRQLPKKRMFPYGKRKCIPLAPACMIALPVRFLAFHTGRRFFYLQSESINLSTPSDRSSGRAINFPLHIVPIVLLVLFLPMPTVTMIITTDPGIHLFFKY